jgi:hypothetical protein
MSFTIGRTVLDDPSVVKVSGDDITLEVDLEALSGPQMKAMRQQLAGLVGNRDEEAFPVIWTDDSTFDGFYRVQSIMVPSSPRMLDTGYTPPAQVSLKRVGGYANPWFELTTQAVVRTNGHGITTPSTVIATGPAQPVSSDNVVDLYPDLGSATTSPIRNTSDGYELRCFRVAAPRTLTSVRFVARPEWFYKGAATLEVQYGTSTWYPVVGTQLYDHGATAPGGSPISAWRISNGIVRMTSTTGFSSSATGTFEIWDNAASAWEVQPAFGFSGQGGPGNVGPRAIIKAPVVVRNGPEHVIVRIQSSRLSETWSIQRGAHFVTCDIYDPAAAGGSKIGLVGVSGSAITGGVVEAGNNGTGNRMVFACVAGALTRSADTANTAVQPSSAAASQTFMVGCELAGTGSLAGNQAADLVNQFVGAVAWRQRIVRQ